MKSAPVVAGADYPVAGVGPVPELCVNTASILANPVPRHQHSVPRGCISVRKTFPKGAWICLDFGKKI